MQTSCQQLTEDLDIFDRVRSFSVLDRVSFGDCKNVRTATRGYLITTLGGISSLTVFLLALDKYLKMARFNHYQDIMSGRKLAMGIMFCWLFPVVAMSSAFWYSKLFGLINGFLTCFILVALPVLYLLIYRFYKQSKRNLTRFKESEARTTSSSAGYAPGINKVFQESSSTASVFGNVTKDNLTVNKVNFVKGRDLDHSAPFHITYVTPFDESTTQHGEVSIAVTRNGGTTSSFKSSKKTNSITAKTDQNTVSLRSNSQIKEQRERKNQRRLVMNILLLMSTYFICTIIYIPISFLASFRLIKGHPSFIYLVLAVYLANSMMNPIIYVFRDKQFRNNVKTMFRMK